MLKEALLIKIKKDIYVFYPTNVFWTFSGQSDIHHQLL